MKKLLELRTSLTEGGYDINILTQLLAALKHYNETSGVNPVVRLVYDFSLHVKHLSLRGRYDFIKRALRFSGKEWLNSNFASNPIGHRNDLRQLHECRNKITDQRVTLIFLKDLDM